MSAIPIDGAAASMGDPTVEVGRPFEDVYRTSYRRLTRLAHVMTSSNELAEEIVQDAFVALYRRFTTVADPDAYLYRSVVNACKARYRRKQVVHRLTRLREVSDSAGPPDIDETRAALDKLSARRRAAVALRYYADLSVDDIAVILECRPATVRSLLHRALADLKELVVR